MYTTVRNGKRSREEYMVGWVHGLYDSVFDDGATYRGHQQLGSVMGGGDTARLYDDGYQAGRAVRRAH